MDDPTPTLPIVVTSCAQTCGACPSQWEGITDDARQVYVRYRWGTLSVRVSARGGKTIDEAVGGPTSTEVCRFRIGGGLAGMMDEEELTKATQGTVVWPWSQNGRAAIDEAIRD